MEEQEIWQDLFDGKTFNGWTQKNGKADYTIENGEIVGTTKLGEPNSFMCTEEIYGDFILEIEYKVHPKMNSGIQIRSNSYAEYKDHRVHGYQIEIDPSDRAWSAGIYDEARRGWLNNLEDNEAAREAFKQNEWNHCHVEARESSIKTWINGVPAADLKDMMTARGFIALEVHSTKETEPMQIRWRNIRLIDLERSFPVAKSAADQKVSVK